MTNKGAGNDRDQPGTYLVIPYYSGDTGSRPLPSSIPFWTCSSIKINGSPYTGQPLTAGEAVSLTVDVINYGTLTTPALCLFFWANPTTSFTNATVHLIGQTSLPLARLALTTTVPISWTVPDGTPEHICLLAELTATSDPAPQDYDAATDRHFGQQNIHVVDAAPGGQIRIPFTMGNRSATAKRYRLEASFVLEKFDALSQLLTAGTVLREAEQLNWRKRSDPGQSLDVLNIELAAGETLEVELTALVPADAQPGSTIVLQLAQYEERRHNPMGGIGVVVNVT